MWSILLLALAVAGFLVLQAIGATLGMIGMTLILGGALLLVAFSLWLFLTDAHANSKKPPATIVLPRATAIAVEFPDEIAEMPRRAQLRLVRKDERAA